MQQAFPKVYILVLNFNNWDDSRGCLESIFKIDYPNYEVVFIDNGSADNSLAKAKAWVTDKTPLTIIETGKNLGYAGGNNAGMKYALEKDDFGYLWILNNDVVVTKDALGLMVKHMQETPKAGICGCAILQSDKPNEILTMASTYRPWFAHPLYIEGYRPYDLAKLKQYQEIEKRMDLVSGASVLVTKEFINVVGLMSEDYFLQFEELDWAIRGRRKKFTLALEPRAIVYHKCGATFSQIEGALKGKQTIYKRTHDRYNTRGRLLFTWKFYPYFLPTVYLALIGDIYDRIKVGAFDNVSIMLEEIGHHFSTPFRWLARQLRKN